ncbi:MAG: phosphoribosyl-AMP cyclohydrolase [Agarilytica sp.]
MNTDFLKDIQWTDDGLVPAIAQDAETGKVLMMAWMNKESLALSVSEQRAVYWSRSRQALWRKGESSGNVQQLKAIRLDCDSDVLLLTVEQLGGIACHTGRTSCFYRELIDGQWQTQDPVIKDPKEMYS